MKPFSSSGRSCKAVLMLPSAQETLNCLNTVFWVLPDFCYWEKNACFTMLIVKHNYNTGELLTTITIQVSSLWLCRYWKVVVSTERADSKKKYCIGWIILFFSCSFHNEHKRLNPAAFLLCIAVKWSAKAAF